MPKSKIQLDRFQLIEFATPLIHWSDLKIFHIKFQNLIFFYINVNSNKVLTLKRNIH